MKIKIVKNKNYEQLKEFAKNFTISEKGDICLAIGGDGSFVLAAKNFDGPILPIRSGEAGSIGYYSDVALKDTKFIINALKRHAYTVETLENRIQIRHKGRTYFAINEALLHNLVEEVSFRVYELRNGKRLLIYPYIMSGDGMLATGLIGSTAYNKSAGGPVILTPNVICLTFLNVDGPYRNPIIIDPTKTIEIEIVKYRGVLRADGEEIKILKPGDRFTVSISKKPLRIIKLKGRSESLADKLERIIVSRMVK